MSKLPQFPQSYWLESTNLSSFPKLTDHIKTEVAVIGGGITGITTAYLLSKKGYKVALIEAGKILTGTTGHTTAKITAQHGLIYDEIISHFGVENAKLYYEANDEALRFIENTVLKHSIECDFKSQDAYIYTNSDQYISKLSKEYDAYKILGIQGELLDHTLLPVPTKSALVMNHQAQFHPLKYLASLVQKLVENGVRIYENTTAMRVDKDSPAIIETRDGKTITCDYAVSCSHFPFCDGLEFYFARMYVERSYVLAVKTEIEYPGGMYINAEEPARSLRSASINGEPVVLIGGENHKTGQGISTHKHYEALEQFAKETFGIQKVLYRWSAQDLITLDKLPFIGPTNEKHPNVIVATGYKKWGMTTGTAAAILIEKLISKQESPYQHLFEPSRFNTDPSLKKFLSVNADVAKHLISGKLEVINRYPEDLNKDEGAVVSCNGKRAGAYRDLEGNLHVVDTTCTHLGCEVEWNSGDRSWDCPCHGSRYSYDGEVLNGPAKKPLKIVEYDEE